MDRKFNTIKTPFTHFKTVRLIDGGDSFRPTATGTDINELELRALMESLEIEASAHFKAEGFIASAAHPDRSTAATNAKNEAIERISLGAWWSLDRPVVGRIDPSFLSELTNNEEGTGFEIGVGFVESVANGYVAAAILKNDSSYPFTVLGGSYGDTLQEAAKSAFYESLQSWTASGWIRNNQQSQQLPAWDIGELRRRLISIEKAPIITQSTANELTSQTTPIDCMTITVKKYKDAYVAWAYTKEHVSGSSQGLAKIAMKDHESISVLTQHNF